MINSLLGSANQIPQLNMERGRQKIEPNPTPAPENISTAPLPSPAPRGIEVHLSPASQSVEPKSSSNGIIDVGDLPDGVQSIDKSTPLSIIDVGDLLDGMQEKTTIDVRV